MSSAGVPDESSPQSSRPKGKPLGFLRKITPKHKRNVFWIGLTGLVLFIGIGGYSDFGKQRSDCKASNSTLSGFLILTELQSGSKQIKTSLLIPTLLQPNFKPETDGLVVESAMPDNTDPSVTRYENLTTYKPDPSSQGKFVWLPVTLPYASNDFFYPFEDYTVNIHLDYRKNGVEAPLQLQVRNNINELILEPCSAKYSFEKTATDVNGFSIQLRRHRFVKFTAGTLYLVAFIFLFYIAKREEQQKVLSNSLGYMAALWGIRQIIIGNSKLFPTIVDFVTLGLYIAVVAIVVYKWLLHMSREEPESQ